MLLELPNREVLYAALLERDARYDGQVYVCVSTTGVFCRLTCPARKPRPENCSFQATVKECVEAGYRPCRRCRPMVAAARSDPSIVGLLEALEAQPERRWSEDDIKARGLDPSTVRRSFRRHFGMTFLELARQQRIRRGMQALSAGQTVLSAQLEASFESPSAFRAAVARLLGVPPAALRSDGLLGATWIPTPLGDMVAVASNTHLYLLEFIDRRGLATELRMLRNHAKGQIGLGRRPPVEQAVAELEAYFDGRSARFETPLALVGSRFAQRVWRALREIPAGETRNYGQIARGLGVPSSARAVARANGANQIALMIPCHRVIGADGSLTGYGGGLWRKQRLIEIERTYRGAGSRFIEQKTGKNP